MVGYEILRNLQLSATTVEMNKVHLQNRKAGKLLYCTMAFVHRSFEQQKQYSSLYDTFSRHTVGRPLTLQQLRVTISTAVVTAVVCLGQYILTKPIPLRADFEFRMFPSRLVAFKARATSLPW